MCSCNRIDCTDRPEVTYQDGNAMSRYCLHFPAFHLNLSGSLSVNMLFVQDFLVPEVLAACLRAAMHAPPHYIRNCCALNLVTE